MREIVNSTRYSTMDYTLVGHDVTLIFTMSHKNRENWAYVVIDNKPISVLSFFHEQPYLDSLEAAETAVLSYMENDGKWSLYPNTYYGSVFRNNNPTDNAPKGHYSKQLSERQFNLEMLDAAGATVDEWMHFGMQYLFVEIPIIEKGSVVDCMKFSIWDSALQEQVNAIFAAIRARKKALAY